MTMRARAPKSPPALTSAGHRPAAARRRRRGPAALAIASLTIACTAQAAGTPVLVDFDHRADGSALPLSSGQVLRDDVVLPYLADYGITIADRTRPNVEIRIAHLTQAGASSGANVFTAFAPAANAGGPWAYRLVFAQPVDNVSFMRAALTGAFTTHDGWQISAIDAIGGELGRVSEGQVSQFGGSPEALARRFDLPFGGIASLLVQGNPSTGGQTFESPVIDDLRFTSPPAVPEPASAWLATVGGLWMALLLRRARRLDVGH